MNLVQKLYALCLKTIVDENVDTCPLSEYLKMAITCERERTQECRRLVVYLTENIIPQTDVYTLFSELADFKRGSEAEKEEKLENLITYLKSDSRRFLGDQHIMIQRERSCGKNTIDVLSYWKCAKPCVKKRTSFKGCSVEKVFEKDNSL